VRVLTSAENQAEADRLTEWICSRPDLARAIVAGLAAYADVERAAAWHDHLNDERPPAGRPLD
jgi:hypothetical protein